MKRSSIPAIVERLNRSKKQRIASREANAPQSPSGNDPNTTTKHGLRLPLELIEQIFAEATLSFCEEPHHRSEGPDLRTHPPHRHHFIQVALVSKATLRHCFKTMSAEIEHRRVEYRVRMAEHDEEEAGMMVRQCARLREVRDVLGKMRACLHRQRRRRLRSARIGQKFGGMPESVVRSTRWDSETLGSV